MENLNDQIRTIYAALEKGASKADVTRNISDTFVRAGHDVDTIKIRKIIDDGFNTREAANRLADLIWKIISKRTKN